MRRNLLKPLLACLLLFSGLVATMAQTTTVMPFTQQWSYLVTNALPPGGWTNVNYPAAAGWATGSAPMATADEAMPGGVPPVLTTLPLDYNGNFVTSFYFRATITLPSNPSNLIFTANAAIDDGAVFYVNGRRVQNVRMTTGAVTHNTFATGDGGGDVSARALDTFTIASTNFVQGTNTIAVSVHQVNGTSTDIAFAMEIETDVIQPPVIVTHPQSQTVQAGRAGVFEVEALGTSLVYRWFTNGIAVPGNNTNRYTTPVTTLSMNGIQYYVVVSNALGRVQSQAATLRVVPDTFGPVAVSAFLTRSNWIEMRFDEVLFGPSATNATSLTNFYVMVLGSGEQLTVTNVTLNTPRTNITVRLVESMFPGSNYVICAYNMRDTSTNAPGGTNWVTLSTCAPITFTNIQNLFAFGETWRYNDNQWLVGSVDPTNGPGGVDWKQLNYPDNPLLNSAWLDGEAPLREDIQFGGIMCQTNTGSALSRTPITTYMRKRFTISSNFPPNATIMIRHQFDDGAVVYLNGRELYRTSMAAGTPNYSTFASAAVEGTCTTAYLAARATNVVRGQNIVAVELHQANESTQPQHDTFFDMELNVVWPFGPIIPDLTITYTNTIPTPSVRLNWQTNAPGWQMQSATALGGPWTPVTTTTGTNHLAPLPAGGSQRFYRMVNPPQP